LDQFSKLAVNLIIVALTAVATVAPASGAGFFFQNNSGISIPSSGSATPYPSKNNIAYKEGLFRLRSFCFEFSQLEFVNFW
jgi:hypothetical protein